MSSFIARFCLPSVDLDLFLGFELFVLPSLVLGSLSLIFSSCLRKPFFAVSFCFSGEVVDFCGDLSVSEHLTVSIRRLVLLPVSIAGFVREDGSDNGCEL